MIEQEKLFNPDEFAQKIRVAKFSRMKNELRKMGLREFADEIGISTSTLSRLQRGGEPDIETYLRVVSWIDRIDGLDSESNL